MFEHSAKHALSPSKSLGLIQFHLKNARDSKDPEIQLVLCEYADSLLEHMKKSVKRTPPANVKNDTEKELREGIAEAYLDHANLMADLGQPDRVLASRKKADKWGGPGAQKTIASPPPKKKGKTVEAATVSESIFPDDVRPLSLSWTFPAPDSRVEDTPQLVSCLGLLRQGSANLPEDTLDPTAWKWLLETEKSEEERARLDTLATDLIRAFTGDEIKDKKAITEVLCLVPVLDEDDFRFLLRQFLNNVNGSPILDIGALRGLAQLLRNAFPGHLKAQDLIEVLGPVSSRLQATHSQSQDQIFELTVAVCAVLDSMADTKVTGLKRVEMHEPLLAFLGGLQGSSDLHLKYYASYAFQALLCVPDDESPWQATVRRTTKVVKGISGLVSAVKGLDLSGFMDGLLSIQEGFEGMQQVFELAKTAYEGVSAVYEGEQDLMDSLKEGLTFNRKRAWYSALRGADTLIEGGELAKFKTLVCEAPCRLELAFQWGICQRLGNLAASPLWGIETRQGAVRFLGEIYRNDLSWGTLPQIKEYILDILKQLAAPSPDSLPDAGTLFKELETEGDPAKLDIYRKCIGAEKSTHLLKSGLPELASPSLLDRVQKKTVVEADLRRIARQRIKERGGTVYVPPLAKASLQASDDALFKLIPVVDEFLESDLKVLLLLGDSGVGKTTFNRELDLKLWKAYKPKTGRIPLLISLPSIDRPEKDLIAKHLRISEFSESQIRELKDREFVIICDGYDESQQTQNLYESNGLNKDGGWKAQMVISCRSEHLGLDYRDLFQPARSSPSDPDLLMQAVLVPFSIPQIKEYIAMYVSIKRPLWEASDYEGVLDQIPSLQELVKNPFLLTLSLEVLPRLTDPGQKLAANKITRVVLYDEFVAQWLERNKKRMAVQDLTDQEKEAFESLSDDGFTQQGLAYLRDLSAAIYKEHHGNPVVEYSKARDVQTWKERFFGRKDDEIRLLRKAIPMTRNGGRFGFIHRSILEYGVSRAIYEPQKKAGFKLETAEPEKKRRNSISSIFSFEDPEITAQEETKAKTSQGPDPDSLLVKRSFIKDISVLQFLAERVHPEPAFKDQLLGYLEYSKLDKKWRIAATNAVSILVRAGYGFSGMDLRGAQIPGADLTNGVFDSVQLQGADLRKVNFRGAWLRQSDFTGAKMTRAQFGEWPTLKDENADIGLVFRYSHDGSKLAAVTSGPNGINIYDTLTWEKLLSLNQDFGEEDDIMGLEFSMDDSLLACGTYEKSVRVYEVQSGKVRGFWTTHSDNVNEVAFSPDGDLVASCSEDSTVRIYNPNTNKEVHVLLHVKKDPEADDYFEGKTVSHVAFSPDGKLLVSSCDDKNVRLWDTRTGECVYVLSGHTESVVMTKFSRSGDRVASASMDGTARIWDVASGRCLYTLEGHTADITSIEYSPNGLQIATTSKDMTARLWDAETGAPGPILKGHFKVVRAIAFSPDSLQVATSSWDFTVRQWDAQTGVNIATLQGHNVAVHGIAYHPNGLQLASSGRDKAIRLWDARSAKSAPARDGHTQPPLHLSYLSGSQMVGSVSPDSSIRLWDKMTGESIEVKTGHREKIHRWAHAPTGFEAATCGDDGTVRLHDLAAGRCKFVLEGHTKAVVDVAYSPDGNLVVSASYDRTLRLWDRHRGTLVRILNDVDALRSVVFSPSGNQIASSSNDHTIRLWDPRTGECQFILKGHTDRAMSVVYSPDGRLLASAGEDKTCRLWDPKTGQAVTTMATHYGTVSVVFSPDGKQIASNVSRQNIQVWDVETGKQRFSVCGDSGSVTGVAFTPDGERIISAGGDMAKSSARVWCSRTGQALAVLDKLPGRVTCLDVDPTFEGTSFSLGCEDMSVSTWRVLENPEPTPAVDSTLTSSQETRSGTFEKDKKQEPLRRVVLVWTSAYGKLVANDTCIEGVTDLGAGNARLLKQRGAKGEPAPTITLRQAAERLIGASMKNKTQNQQAGAETKLAESVISAFTSSKMKRGDLPLAAAASSTDQGWGGSSTTLVSSHSSSPSSTLLTPTAMSAIAAFSSKSKSKISKFREQSQASTSSLGDAKKSVIEE
ncbi:hypothetical protein EMPS_00181 [Entomortierella parvispora]|uniref:NACHT domain-containing protein n=1 Tax=Entomortierella parvispora TaxID=205924 RepID=A0A9P3GZP7_9FUNG|nr:hypothetical protein EMPS_00181 [Entomortierella parvispora]